MQLDDFSVYRQAMDVAERVWLLVNDWDDFSKDTIGKPLLAAADWIAVNLSKGFGRHINEENQQYTLYSRGSLYEAYTWLKKANNRGLIGAYDYEELDQNLGMLLRMLNMYLDSSSTTAPPVTPDTPSQRPPSISSPPRQRLR